MIIQLLSLSEFTYNISFLAIMVLAMLQYCFLSETEFIYGVGTNTFNGGLHIVDVSDVFLLVLL